MRVLERSDSKLGCHSPFKMSGDASLFCLYCLRITPPGIQISACSGFCLFAARFMGGFWAFNGSRRIPISTFGHSNACRQSRRTDCGLSHVCLRSSAACAFNGVLCVLDGFAMKCPKVETMCLDGAEIPGSVNFGGTRSQLYGATGPFLWCAELVLTARGLVALCFLGSDEQICLRETTIKFTRAGATINFSRGGATSKYDRGERRTKKTPRRAPCMQISSQEGERRVCDASALRSGPPCRT